MERLTRGQTYRHPAMIDVDMHVIRAEYIGPEYFKLVVCWVYRRDPKMLIGPDRVKLMRKDWSKWQRIPA